MVIWQIVALILLCFALIFATGLIVRSLKSFARASHLGAYSITAFLLAISTSLPELVVSVVAALENNTSLVLGNIIGSNIADLSLVIGGAALVGGSLKIGGNILSRDIYLTGAAGLLPIFLIADGVLSAPDGIVLLVVYLIMTLTFLGSHHRTLASHALSTSPIKRLLSSVTGKNGHHTLAKLVAGIGILLLSSHLIVQLYPYPGDSLPDPATHLDPPGTFALRYGNRRLYRHLSCFRFLCPHEKKARMVGRADSPLRVPSLCLCGIC